MALVRFTNGHLGFTQAPGFHYFRTVGQPTITVEQEQKWTRPRVLDRCQSVPVTADGKIGLPSARFYEAVARQRLVEFIDSALAVLWEKYWGNGNPTFASRAKTKVWLWQIPGLEKLRPPLDNPTIKKDMWKALNQLGFHSYDTQGRHYDRWLRMLWLAQRSKANDAGGPGQPGAKLFDWMRRESLPIWDIEKSVKEGSAKLGEKVPAYKNFYKDVLAHMAKKKANPTSRYYDEEDYERGQRAGGDINAIRRSWIEWRCPWVEPLVYGNFESEDFKENMPGVTADQAMEIYSTAVRGINRDPSTGAAPEDPSYFDYLDLLSPPNLKKYDAQPYGFDRVEEFILEALILLQEEGDSTGKRGVYLWDLPGFKEVQLEGLKGWQDILTGSIAAVGPKVTWSEAEKLKLGTFQGFGEGSMQAPKEILLQQKLGVYLKPVPQPPYINRKDVEKALGPMDAKTKEITKNWWPTQVNAWSNSIGETYSRHMIPASRWEKTLNEADPAFANRVYKSLMWEKPTDQVFGKAATTISNEIQKNQTHRAEAQASRAEAWEERPWTEKISDFSTRLTVDPSSAFDVQLPTLLPDMTPIWQAAGAIGGGIAGLIGISIPSWIVGRFSSVLGWGLWLSGIAGGVYFGYSLMSPKTTGSHQMFYRPGRVSGFWIAPPTVAGTLGNVKLPGAVPPPPAVNPSVYASNYSCSVPNIQTFLQPPCNAPY